MGYREAELAAAAFSEAGQVFEGPPGSGSRSERDRGTLRRLSRKGNPS